MRAIILILALCTGTLAMADTRNAEFANIDGGTLNVSQWAGQPILVVNTASRCGFTPQYEALQAVYDKYREQGLVVLAVPSDDFNQELENAEAVKDFCEITYGLDLPMTDITSVKGADPHPFFQSVKAATGFSPKWNFNKILIAPDGSVAGTWGSTTRPDARPIRRAIEDLLG